MAGKIADWCLPWVIFFPFIFFPDFCCTARPNNYSREAKFKLVMFIMARCPLLWRHGQSGVVGRTDQLTNSCRWLFFHFILFPCFFFCGSGQQSYTREAKITPSIIFIMARRPLLWRHEQGDTWLAAAWRGKQLIGLPTCHFLVLSPFSPSHALTRPPEALIRLRGVGIGVDRLDGLERRLELSKRLEKEGK